jgi:Flp pilus assembly protein CpaB
MNPNGTYESEVNRKIDRALAGGLPTGEPVIDDLASAVPQASPGFQQGLEDKLIERLMTKARKTEPMNAATTRTPARFTLPATLVAAMLAVVFGGVIFGMMNNRAPNYGAALSPDSTEEATQVAQMATATPVPLQTEGEPFFLTATAIIQTATQSVLDLTRTAESGFELPENTVEVDPFVPSATAIVKTATQEALNLTTSPTPTILNGVFITFTPDMPPTTIPTIDLVVAVMPIQPGQKITADMVALRPWPEMYAPINALFNVEDVIGTVARTYIVREQPILNGMIAPVDVITVTPVLETEIVPPPGSRVVAVPITRVEGMEVNVQPGDRADILALDPDHWDVLVSNALVTYMGEIAGIPNNLQPVFVVSGDSPVAVVAVQVEDAGRLVSAIDAGTALTLRVTSSAQMQQPVVIARYPIEPGTVLTEDMLALASFPAGIFPEGGFKRIEDAVGQTVLAALPLGYPVVMTPILPITPTFTPTTPPVVLSEGCEAFAGEKGVQIWSAPDVNSAPVGTLPASTGVMIYNTTGEWLYIRMPAETWLEGWIQVSELQPTTELISCLVGKQQVLPTPTPVQDTDTIQYTVQDGDTLILILSRFDFSTDDLSLIQRANPHLATVNGELQIRPGDVLVIPLRPTPTPISEALLCLFTGINEEALVVRSQPSISAETVGSTQVGRVIRQEYDADGRNWYFVQTVNDGASGWIQAELTRPQDGSPCPYLPVTPPPTLTPTPQILCQVIAVTEEGLIVGSRPSTGSSRLGVVPFSTPMNVTQQVHDETGRIWFFIHTMVDTAEISGWVRQDNTRPQTGSVCPELPE